MERVDIRDFLDDTAELKRIIKLTKNTDIEYLEKRAAAKEYDPLGEFAYGTWKDILADPEIRKRYESLHTDLLYTSEKQSFSDALEALEQVARILSEIGE